MADQERQDHEQSVTNEIFSTIIQLNRERLDYEHEHKFFEAGRIKDQLKKLGEEYTKVSLYTLRERQRQEKEGLEAEYEKELEELSKTWEERLQKNEEEIRNFMEATQERQREELGRFESDLKQNIPQQGRMSSEILNLEYQIEMLVKDQRYTEAGQLQKKLESQRNNCMIKISNKTEEKIRNMLEAVVKRQENEFVAIEKRLNSDREELLKMRDKDFEKIHSKFRVFREKLENNHNSEFIREERKLKSFNPSSNHLANLA